MSQIRIRLTVEYNDTNELQLFCNQLQRFLNNNMALVEVTTDDLPCQDEGQEG